MSYIHTLDNELKSAAEVVASVTKTNPVELVFVCTYGHDTHRNTSMRITKLDQRYVIDTETLSAGRTFKKDFVVEFIEWQMMNALNEAYEVHPGTIRSDK